MQCPPNSFSPPASAWCHCNRGYEGPDAYLEVFPLPTLPCPVFLCPLALSGPCFSYTCLQLRDVAALGQGNDDNGAVAERDAIAAKLREAEASGDQAARRAMFEGK